MVRNLGLLTMLIVLLAACSKDSPEPRSQEDPISNEQFARGEKGNSGDKGNKGGKGKKDEEPPAEPEPINYTSHYRLSQRDDFDALYEFYISENGDQILFRTDSTITHWGVDYWGAWSDPFDFVDNTVERLQGLTFTTYTFVPQNDGSYDIYKRLIVTQYLSNTTDTTDTHLGIYTLQ